MRVDLTIYNFVYLVLKYNYIDFRLECVCIGSYDIKLLFKV